MDPTFLTALRTFNCHCFEPTFISCDAPASHHWNHLTYIALLKRGLLFADDDLNWCKNEAHEDNVSSHDSNDSYLDMAEGNICPIHPTSKHKWGECSQNLVNQSIKQDIITFSPVLWQTITAKDTHALTESDN